MKLNLLVLIFLGLLLSCNNKENKQTNAEDYYQFKVVDLSPYDLNATLFIPDETAGIGASFQTTIEHEEEFKWKVMAGPNFQLFIEDWGDNASKLAEFRKSLQEDDVFKVSIISDEEDCIIYKRQLIKHINVPKYKHVSYHIYSLINLGDYYYEIKNKASGDSKIVIDLMKKSVKSFKIKSN
jgi:hypothetical protein